MPSCICLACSSCDESPPAERSPPISVSMMVAGLSIERPTFDSAATCITASASRGIRAQAPDDHVHQPSQRCNGVATYVG